MGLPVPSPKAGLHAEDRGGGCGYSLFLEPSLSSPARRSSELLIVTAWHLGGSWPL